MKVYFIITFCLLLFSVCLSYSWDNIVLSGSWSSSQTLYGSASQQTITGNVVDEWIQTENNTITGSNLDYQTYTIGSVEAHNLSWTTLQNTWFVSTNIWSGDIFISQVYVLDTNMSSEFFEITSHIDFVWDIRFVWLWRWAAEHVFHIDIKSGESVVFSEDTVQLTGSVLFMTDSITLTNTWEEIFLYIDNLLIDHITYTLHDEEYSVSWNGHNEYPRELSAYTTISSHEEYTETVNPGNEEENWSQETEQQEETLSGSTLSHSIFITEIHPTDGDQFGEYIELFF